MEKEMNPVGWFEIPTTDLARAQTFYEHVLQIELNPQTMGDMEMAWFPMYDDLYGATGSLVKHDMMKPSDQGALIYFSCEDIDAALARVEEKGGKIFCGKKNIGDHGFIGIAFDTEGNRFALHCLY